MIAQSVRASERNSVVVGSNPTQTKYIYGIHKWHSYGIYVLYIHTPVCV